jgi:Uma2 family endonuclease
MSVIDSRNAALIEQSSFAETMSEELANGDNLSRDEFIRIWEKLPNLKKAELIEGIVYMPSPLKLRHSVTDNDLTIWLGTYRLATPFCQSGSNGTWLMLESAPQPDQFLRLLPEAGGQSHLENDLPVGAPELAIEVASSTVSYDLHQKLRLYREAGVQEYLVAILRKPEIRWHRRVGDEYLLLEPDSAGVFRSLVFPGLWLNSPALLRGDMNAVMAMLQEGLRSPEHAEFVTLLQTRTAKDKLQESSTAK